MVRLLSRCRLQGGIGSLVARLTFIVAGIDPVWMRHGNKRHSTSLAQVLPVRFPERPTTMTWPIAPTQNPCMTQSAQFSCNLPGLAGFDRGWRRELAVGNSPQRRRVRHQRLGLRSESSVEIGSVA